MTEVSSPVVADQAAQAGQTGMVRRTPLYFGPASRPLFGWYHEPGGGARSEIALALCPPLGHEYVNSYRALRRLADGCAAAGVPTLRFDYDGTGNSAGADEDPDRLAAWLSSIRAAMSQLRLLSGCREPGLAGLRIGATLAAVASAEADVSFLVLWAPCTRGQAYMRELKAMQLTASAAQRPEPAAAGDIEAGGFVFTEQTQRDLGGLNLQSARPRARRILIAARGDLAEDPSLRLAWSGAGLRVEQRSLPGYADMMAEPQDTAVPHAAIRELVAWIDSGESAQERTGPAAGLGVAGCTRAARLAPPNPCPDLPAMPGREIQESIVCYGPAARRFGILSEPVDAPARALPTVVLPNAGATHTAGPNRLYVLLARSLSLAGFRCFRLDLPGLGDSAADDPERENDVYLPTAGAEVALALEALAAQVAEPYVLMGLCSGAHTTFHAGLELPSRRVAECVLINPLTFYYKRGMSLRQPTYQTYRQWQEYTAALRIPARWVKLLSSGANVHRVWSTMVAQARLRLEAAMRTWRRRWKPTPATADDLETDLPRLLESGIELTFVLSRADPGYAMLTTDGGRTARRLIREKRIAIRFIEAADHTFSMKQPRCALIDTVVRHLVQRYASAGAPW